MDTYNNRAKKRLQPPFLTTPYPEEEQFYEDAEFNHWDNPSTDLFTQVPVDNNLFPPSDFDTENDISHEETWIIPAIQVSSKRLKSGSKNVAREGSASNIRNLVKSSGVYALSSLASPLISLVLAPFLTHNLSHTDFGALAVLNTVIALMAGVTQLGLNSAFFRSYNYDYESQRDRLGVLSTLVILLSLISIPTAIVMIAAAPWLATFLLGSASFSGPVRLTGIVVLVQNLSIPGFAWLRAENRAFPFSILSIANLLTVLTATLILVGVLHLGIAGSLIATGAGYAVVIICMLPLILLRTGIHLRIDIAKGLLSFGLPNVSNFVSVWILQLSDRYLLSHLGSLSQTASYAVAYSLGGVLSAVVIAPFSLAWPTTMYAIAKKDAAPQAFQLVFRWFSIVLLFAAFGLSLASTVMLNLLFPPSYHAAAPIIPIIAASMAFYGAYIIFTTGVSIQRKTWFAVAFTTTSAIVNVGLNVILIPHYGAIGAAASTLIAYVVLALAAYIVNQLLYPIPFEIGRFTVALFIGTALYIGGSYFAQSQGILITCCIYSIVLAIYGGCLVLLAGPQIISMAANKISEARFKHAQR